MYTNVCTYTHTQTQTQTLTQADQQLSLLEAKKKSMEILEKIRAKHRKIQEMGGPIVNSGPRLVDIRVRV